MDHVKTLNAAVDEAIERTKTHGLQYDERLYLPVKERLAIFRAHFGTAFGIDTNVYVQDNMIIGSAKITCGGETIASGHGMIDLNRDKSANAPVETVETFAIGRALACLGLIGSEYASAQEMERVKGPAAVDSRRIVAHSHAGGLSDEGRKFKEAVENNFPAIGDVDFFIPEDITDKSFQMVFAQIDRINDRDGLAKYLTLLEEWMTWIEPEDIQDIKASFRTRRDQLKGD